MEHDDDKPEETKGKQARKESLERAVTPRELVSTITSANLHGRPRI